MTDPAPITTDEAPQSDDLMVLDRTALPGRGNRTHEVFYGGLPHSYTFEPGKYRPMPREHAMKLVSNEGFIVKDENGERIEPVPDVKPGDAIPKLAPGLVIARIDELHNYALLLRCQQYDGASHFKKTTKKDELLAFLLDAQKGQAEARKPKPASVPADLDSADGIAGEDAA